jgi:hypothetical protein
LVDDGAHKVITSPPMAKSRAQANRLAHEQLYLNSVPASVLPRGAPAAAFDIIVRFIETALRTLLVAGLVVAAGAFFTGAICGSGPGPRLVHLRPRLDPPPRRRGRRGYRAGRPVDPHPPRCAPHRAVALAARALPRCQPPTVGMRDRPRTAESPPASSQS